MTEVVRNPQAASFRPAPLTDEAPTADRLAWVDIAKGLGIILVVYGHAVRGFWGTRTWPAWTVTQDALIYAFHMPLFFMVGGLFLWRSIGRGRILFIRSRWWALIYPYLLWSMVCGGVEVAASRFANTPISFRDLLQIPFVPVEQFWFLYALLIVQLIAMACFPSRIALAFVAIVGFGLASLTQSNIIVPVALRFLPFLAAGVCGAVVIKRLSAAGAKLQLATFGLSWMAFVALYASGIEEPWSKIILGSFGSIGSLSAAMLIARFPAGRSLALLGRASMAIYVLHTLFSAGVRIGFTRLGIDRYALWTLVPEVLVGLLLPVPFWLWSQARPSGYLLGFGDQPSKALREISQADPIDRRSRLS